MRYITLCLGLIIITSCGGGSAKNHDTLTFWIAPNATQERFWSEVIDEWNEAQLGMPIVYKTIPNTGSSEEAILSALASDSAPDISENIFSGFGAQLQELNIVHNLAQMEGYEELISQRHMNNLIKGWQKDGQTVVFPIYANPVLFWWRGDLLTNLGITEVPKTFDEIYAISQHYAQRGQYVVRVLAGRNWWDRWFDIISYYYATSEGMPYIEDNQVVMNEQAMKEVLTYIQTMHKNSWTSMEIESNIAFFDGSVLGEVKGPWDIAFARSQFPEVVQHVKIGPMLQNQANRSLPYTLADTKGLVIFKTSKHPQEAWKFIQWVMSKDEFSKRWIEYTGMPPARGDLLENPLLAEAYAADPLAREYAKHVNVALPSSMHSATIDIQTAMTVKMVEPLVLGMVDVNQAYNDGVATIESMIR